MRRYGRVLWEEINSRLIFSRVSILESLGKLERRVHAQLLVDIPQTVLNLDAIQVEGCFAIRCSRMRKYFLAGRWKILLQIDLSGAKVFIIRFKEDYDTIYPVIWDIYSGNLLFWNLNYRFKNLLANWLEIN